MLLPLKKMYIHVDILCFFISRNYFFIWTMFVLVNLIGIFVKNIQEMCGVCQENVFDVLWFMTMALKSLLLQKLWSTNKNCFWTICGLLLRLWWKCNQLTILRSAQLDLPRFLRKAMLFCLYGLQTTAVISFN